MDDVETGRRLRAARGYAGLDADEVAQALNFSVSTLYRTEAGTRPLTEAERARAAELCKLPLGFFSVDFANPDERQVGAVDEVRNRVERLEALVRNVDARTRLQNVETQLAAVWTTISNLEREGDATRSQVEELTREALARRTREAAERERQRRDTKRESPPAEGAQ